MLWRILLVRTLVVVLGAHLAAGPTWGAKRATLPAGTVIYGETQERVTSRKKETSEGDFVQAIVWRDVVIGSQVVVKAGTPMVLRVEAVKKAKLAGIKGKLELRAFSTTAVDGTQIPLVGGYDKSGKGRMGLSIALAALVFVPLIFIRGKQAVLEPGTVFDAQIQGNTELALEEVSAPRRISLIGSDLSIEVLYDEVPEGKKPRYLPIRLTLCADDRPASARVLTVNDEGIDAIEVTLEGSAEVDGCVSTKGRIELDPLAKHFRKGINRFEVVFGAETAEVILDVEV